jgi:hypothetical protein
VNGCDSRYSQIDGFDVCGTEPLGCTVRELMTLYIYEVDQKYVGSLKCGAGEGWRKSVGPIV